MLELSEEQLNHLNKDALVIIAASLQDQLRSMAQQLENANARLDDNNRQIELLTEQIRLMNQRQFGRKSEAYLSEMEGQLTLFDSFNEVEGFQKPDIPEPTIEEVTISSYRRSKAKGKREADLDGLPARIFEHKLSEEELAEKFPEGYKELPPEVYKRLHTIPETFIVDEHHVHIYASKNNDGTIGKALAYSINHEQYLRVFLSDGNVPPDNNYAEQAIRPFTIGRKNFVLMESDHGAKASAMIYSIVETAKANGLNTYQYLELLLTELPKHAKDKNLSFLDELLPWSDRVQAECPSRYKKS